MKLLLNLITLNSIWESMRGEYVRQEKTYATHVKNKFIYIFTYTRVFGASRVIRVADTSAGIFPLGRMR